MRQQKRLLRILSKTVIAIALAFSASLFSDDAAGGNRDNVKNDLIRLAARAHQYYRRPAALGGGGRSFVGLTADPSGLAKLTSWPDGKSGNGIYYVSSAGTLNSVIISGVGRDTVAGGNYVCMFIVVREQGLPDSVQQVY